MLYRHPKSVFWWCCFQWNSVKIRRSTGKTDRREAEARARQIRAKYEESHPRPQRGRGRLADLAAADIARALAEGADKDTREQTLNWIWKQVLQYWGTEFDPAEIGYDHVLDYVGFRRATARGQTIRREVSALRRGLTIAMRRGWIHRMPDQWPKIKKDPPKESQAGKLHAPNILQAIVARLSPDARDGIVFALMTGLRDAELRRVQAGWIRPAPPGLAVKAFLHMPAWATKTRKERTIALPDIAVEAVKSRLEEFPDATVLFPRVSYRKQIAKASEAIGYKAVVTMRDLRHVYATTTVLGTGDAKAVQASMGHADLAMTEKYLSTTLSRAADVGAAAEKLLNPTKEPTK